MRPLKLTLSALGPTPPRRCCPGKSWAKAAYTSSPATPAQARPPFRRHHLRPLRPLQRRRAEGPCSAASTPTLPRPPLWSWNLRCGVSGTPSAATGVPPPPQSPGRGLYHRESRCHPDLCRRQAPGHPGQEVTAAVIELIGLDYNQFSQIAMIAQGQFTRLLNATTEERSRIFRKLFRHPALPAIAGRPQRPEHRPSAPSARPRASGWGRSWPAFPVPLTTRRPRLWAALPKQPETPRTP